MTTRVLCLIVEGFEEIELVTPVDLLRRAEVEVVLAGLACGPVRGRCGIAMLPDVLLGEIETSGFDALLIPGGPGVAELRKDGRAAELAATFHAAGKWVAAICAAPLVLHDAGLLTGRQFAAHSSVLAQLPKASAERVVVDGLLITSRGAGTAFEFGMALAHRLAGSAAAEKVAMEVMA